MKNIYKNKFFINFLLFFCVFYAFFANFSKKLVVADVFNTPEVEHFFTHCLIVNPTIAFDKNNTMAYSYDKDCITSLEFENILSSLYEKNYCVVNANECFNVNENGKAVKSKLNLPYGKKPFILSIDDVNYDTKKMHLGMADKITVDQDGKLCSVINGKYDYKLEFVNILNNFIKKHPDFSHNNAKAMLCLTGYDGILGYRTQNGNINEINDAKRVVNTLKQNGYYFACHSYGHYHMKKINSEVFKQELTLWKNQVEPIIGKTNIYVYPYGEYEILSNNQVSQKHQQLIDYGFKLFCGVGEKHFFSYYPFNTTEENKVLFMDRIPLDGFSLRQNVKIYSKYFDCFAVYDKKNRKVSFN